MAYWQCKITGCPSLTLAGTTTLLTLNSPEYDNYLLQVSMLLVRVNIIELKVDDIFQLSIVKVTYQKSDECLSINESI